MTRTLIPFAVLTATLSLALVACGGGDDDSAETQRSAAPTPTSAPLPPPISAPAPTSVPASGGQTGATVVDVLNKDTSGSGVYEFDPADFTFKLGDTVTFRSTAETEFHTFTVDALGIDESIGAGETIEFTVTFDKAGTFTLICIPHAAYGMTGSITVNS
ncbi:MAG: cupredoxin domain-containing protein [Chloroflexi bacterium]|nr:cupredoxin domain-containing protein [Chloroflexota bacterium]